MIKFRELQQSATDEYITQNLENIVTECAGENGKFCSSFFQSFLNILFQIVSYFQMLHWKK